MNNHTVAKPIIRFIRKKKLIRFLINVLLPFALPVCLSIITTPDEILHNNVGLAILFVMLLNAIAQFASWLKEVREEEVLFENRAANFAYNNLYETQKSKNFQLRNTYHIRKNSRDPVEAIPYNVFDQIKKIAWEFGHTVGDITSIQTKDIDVSFIYHYTYKDATPDDTRWRWVTGKGSKFKEDLDNFVTNCDSVFHYLSYNNISTVFFNDKKAAHDQQFYVYSDKDYTNHHIGSIVAAKLAFSGNDNVLCEGILMVNTYGHRFLDKCPTVTESELRELILESILPCYKNLLEEELAMLYFRHLP